MAAAPAALSDAEFEARVGEVLKLLDEPPPQPPPGLAHRPGQGYVVFDDAGPPRVRFQTTYNNSGNSPMVAERILLLCYGRFSAGDTREQVTQFRNTLYDRVKGILGFFPPGQEPRHRWKRPHDSLLVQESKLTKKLNDKLGHSKQGEFEDTADSNDDAAVVAAAVTPPHKRQRQDTTPAQVPVSQRFKVLVDNMYAAQDPSVDGPSVLAAYLRSLSRCATPQVVADALGLFLPAEDFADEVLDDAILKAFGERVMPTFTGDGLAAKAAQLRGGGPCGQLLTVSQVAEAVAVHRTSEGGGTSALARILCCTGRDDGEIFDLLRYLQGRTRPSRKDALKAMARAMATEEPCGMSVT